MRRFDLYGLSSAAFCLREKLEVDPGSPGDGVALEERYIYWLRNETSCRTYLGAYHSIILNLECEKERRLIGAGAATVALAGTAAGIGNVFCSLMHPAARNPSSEKEEFGYAIRSVKLIECLLQHDMMHKTKKSKPLPLTGT